MSSRECLAAAPIRILPAVAGAMSTGIATADGMRAYTASGDESTVTSCGNSSEKDSLLSFCGIER